MSAASQELRQLARDLAAAQKAAAELTRSFAKAMLAELRGSASGDSPATDLEIVEVLAAVDVHVGAVAEVVSMHRLTMAMIIVESRRPVELARRVLEAASAGEEEARRDCPCTKCKERRTDAGRAVDAAVRASTERARGGA